MNIYFDRIKLEEFPERLSLPGKFGTRLEGVNFFYQPDGQVGFEPVYQALLDYENLGEIKLITLSFKRPVGTLIIHPRFPFFKWIRCTETELDDYAP